MNILLADIQALSLDLRDLPEVDASQGRDFARMLQHKLDDFPAEGQQTYEFKGLFLQKTLDGEASMASPDAGETRAWHDFLAQTQVQVTTDSDPLSVRPIEAAAGLTGAPASVGAPAPARGEALPVSGNALPPLSPSSGVTVPASGQSSATLPIASTTSAAVTPGTEIVPQARPNATADEMIRPEAGRGEGRSTLDPLAGLRAASTMARTQVSTAQGAEPIALAGVNRADRVQADAARVAPLAGTRVAHMMSRSELAARPPLQPVPAEVAAPVGSATPPSRAAIAPPIGAPLPPANLDGDELNRPPAPQLTDNAAERAASVDPRIQPRPQGIAPHPVAEIATAEVSAARSGEVAPTQAANPGQPTPVPNLAPALDRPAPLLPANPLPTQLETLGLARANDPAEWSQGLGDRVNWMVNHKQNSATIRLDPPMLGKLEVQIRMADDGTTVAIQTQHLQTRDLVEASATRLRDFLQDSGFQNVSVDVSHRQDQQHARASMTGDADAEASEDFAAADDGGPDTESAFTDSNSSNLVDTFV